MRTSLDVLLIETHDGAGEEAATRLAADGHRIHRCWEPGTVGTTYDTAFPPCSAMTEGTCPLDDGIDVALLVRRGISPEPTAAGSSVRCALRAGVPVVEDGADLLDPFEPWITARTGTDLVASCQEAAGAAFAPVVEELRTRVEPVLVEAGVDPDELAIAFDVDGTSLVIRLDGPEVDERTRQAISVRALTALTRTRRRFTRVDVAYREPAPL